MSKRAERRLTLTAKQESLIHALCTLADSAVWTLHYGSEENRKTVAAELSSEDHPTKGYAHRPGWHCGRTPLAPHLSLKGRTWFEVEIEDFYRSPRPKHQGGEWLIAKRMKVIGPVEIRRAA